MLPEPGLIALYLDALDTNMCGANNNCRLRRVAVGGEKGARERERETTILSLLGLELLTSCLRQQGKQLASDRRECGSFIKANH